MRQRFCRVCGGWHSPDAWPHNCMPVAQGAPSTAVPVPGLIIDTMQPVQSMLDGKMYDSKSRLRATYRAGGVEEVGNDPAHLQPKKREKVDQRKIVDAIDRAQSRFNRGERVNTP